MMTVAELEAFCRAIRNAKGTDATEVKVVTERGTVKGLGTFMVYNSVQSAINEWHKQQQMEMEKK